MSLHPSFPQGSTLVWRDHNVQWEYGGITTFSGLFIAPQRGGKQMKRLYIIAITTTLLAMAQSPRLIEASCTGGSLCIDPTYYQKGVEEKGQVWYLTVFAGTTPPEV